MNEFIHPGYFYSAFSSPLLSAAPNTARIDAVPEFHAEASQATASEGIA